VIIQELRLSNFRCFQERTVSFDGRVIVLEGPNGSGKSSILEALHYCCYLRSFRTHLNRELIQLGKDYFFVHVDVHQESTQLIDQIQVGFSDSDGKVVKWNQKPVVSYKDLIGHFKIVSVAADDLILVHGGPEYRRDFLNYALALNNPEHMTLLKRYRQILDQRNSLLQQSRFSGPSEEMAVWSQKLWEASQEIRQLRSEYLRLLEVSVNLLLQIHFADTESGNFQVKFVYAAKNGSDTQTFDDFWRSYALKQYNTEVEWGRSLFGAHLDDFSIIFQDKKARMYASRGQQKLLVLLIKIAQLQQLSALGEPGVLLLDDFMTDFDNEKVERSVATLNDLKFQMFVSCPVRPDAFLRCFSPQDVSHLRLER
jgi:DNA replication and repair protein RecF